MKTIAVNEGKMNVVFRIDDSGSIELTNISAGDGSSELPSLSHNDAWRTHDTHQLIALQITGESSTSNHAGKHNAGSRSDRMVYQDHSLTKNQYGTLLTIHLSAGEGLEADYFMQFYTGIAMVRTYVTLRNIGKEDIGIDFVSSFTYNGIAKDGTRPYYEKTEIYVPYNSWSSEAQWQHYDVSTLGLSHMPIEGHNLPEKGNNRFSYGNCGSWSSCQYLPMGMAKDRETGEIYYFEIEHSGSWEIEYGSGNGKNLYLTLLGPNDESAWWKNLKPGEEFTTVPAAFGVCIGDESDAVGELTRYRRAIRRPNEDDVHCHVVFNDYMNCLMGDPTEERELAIIDKAADLGCEYYCMDCGWYDKGFWWDKVGEWKESKERFPHGLKRVYDYAHAKNMKMGMWLEIEVMGTECELASRLPDDWFICLHGKRRIDNKRYLLDFRNPDVRRYCSDVVERLIKDYGVDYFKIDYNVTTGPGSDVDSDSPGDAMLDHYRTLYQWYQDLYQKYPDLVIENCGSGAQRMDYGILSLQCLQSTSDQTDYISNSYISSNVASAVAPEQAGMWVYPYEDNAEHVIYNVVNGILLRPYISGEVWKLSRQNFGLLKEGIDVYKSIRGNFTGMTPFFPNGFHTVKSDVLLYGLRGEHLAYLTVQIPRGEEADIALCGIPHPKEVKVIYPEEANCEWTVEGSMLHVRMPQNACGRLFEFIY